MTRGRDWDRLRAKRNADHNRPDTYDMAHDLSTPDPGTPCVVCGRVIEAKQTAVAVDNADSAWFIRWAHVECAAGGQS